MTPRLPRESPTTESEAVTASPTRVDDSADVLGDDSRATTRTGGLRGLWRRPHFRVLGGVVVVLLAVLILVLSLVDLNRDPALPVGGPAGVHWKIQFDENFSGDKASLLDSGVWHAGWFGDGELTKGVNSDETALLSSANLSLADGRARLEVTPNTHRLKLRDGTTKPNVGAALNTDDKQSSQGFMFTYGYVEARMQMPAGAPAEEVWPSFWLTGHTWPDDMEIDVVEGNGTDQGNKFNIHYGRAGDDTVNLDRVHRARMVPGATTGMHTYAADIRPDGVTFYYDGKSVYAYHGSVPDEPRFLMVGASTSGTVTSTKSLEVDYVRAWTRD